MEFDFFKASVLAIIQGFTEFLPISSSAHILLPKELWGWEDQGLIFDVAVHVGSLLAVMVYFRRDIALLAGAWLRACFRGVHSAESRIAWCVIVATLPAGLAGFLLSDLVATYSRSMVLIGVTSIVFAGLLFAADRLARQHSSLDSLTLKSALVIGFFQILALMPGTSRSGITMTAGLFCGLDRRAAAKFSFLLAIPIILASGVLEGVALAQQDNAAQWGITVYGMALSALVSYACIHTFLQVIERIGFMPFIVYRVIMGAGLLALYASRVS